MSIRGHGNKKNGIFAYLAVLVKLQLGDHTLRGVDAHVDGGTVNLLAGDALDVDHPLAAVALHNLTLALLVCAAHHLNLVILADGQRADLQKEGAVDKEKILLN